MRTPILRGDMSMVGPRPVVKDELELYGPAADYISISCRSPIEPKCGSMESPKCLIKRRLRLEFGQNQSISAREGRKMISVDVQPGNASSAGGELLSSRMNRRRFMQRTSRRSRGRLPIT